MAKDKAAKGKQAERHTKDQVSKVALLNSRIRMTGPGSETAKLNKEDAAKLFAEEVLKASAEAIADVQKTNKGRCVLVKFSKLPCEARVIAFVFGGDHVIVQAESDDPTILYNTLKRTYASVPDAAKFVRCAFIKGKVDLALKVPVKPQKRYDAGSGGARSSANHSDDSHSED